MLRVKMEKIEDIFAGRSSRTFKKCAFPVTKLRFSCSLLKNPILRDECWARGKIALLGKPAVPGRRWTPVLKSQLPRFCSEIYREKRKGLRAGERAVICFQR